MRNRNSLSSRIYSFFTGQSRQNIIYSLNRCTHISILILNLNAIENLNEYQNKQQETVSRHLLSKKKLKIVMSNQCRS